MTLETIAEADLARVIARAAQAALDLGAKDGVELEVVDDLHYKRDRGASRGYAVIARRHAIPHGLFTEASSSRVRLLPEVRELVNLVRPLVGALSEWRGGFEDENVARIVLQHCLMLHLRDAASVSEAAASIAGRLYRGAFGPCVTRFVAPLDWLDMGEDDPLALDASVTLRPIRDDEIGRFAVPEAFRAALDDRHPRLSVVLEERVEHRPGTQPAPGPAVDRVLTALQLMGAHGIGCVSIERETDWWTWGTQSIGGPSRAPHGPGFSLNTVEHRTDLKRWYDLVSSVETLDVQPMPVALRRFRMAMERARPEDRFVDVSIALEAALMGGVGKDITNRFAARGSRLLATDAVEREETRKRLEALYNKRSRLLHGTTSSLDVDDLHDLLPYAEFVLSQLFEILLPAAATCGDRRAFSRYLEQFDP